VGGGGPASTRRAHGEIGRPSACRCHPDRGCGSGGSIGWALPGRDRGGRVATPGTCGPAEGKESGSGPKKQCNFLLNKK
jgi:hypothetical protein